MSFSGPIVKTNPMGHQQDILDWMKDHKGGVIQSEMGSGKTLVMLKKYTDHDIKRDKANSYFTLVVVPKAGINVFVDEIDKHCENFKYSIYLGDKRKLPLNRNRKKMIITTYETIVSDYNQGKMSIFNITFEQVFIDESHRIRNHYSSLSKTISKIKGDYKWCFTGTPFYNNARDFIGVSIFCGIEPYNDRKWWVANEQHMIENKITSWRNSMYFKTDYVQNIPCSEHNIFLDQYEPERVVYSQVMEQIQGNLFKSLSVLKQNCIHQELLRWDKTSQNVLRHSAKTQRLLDLVNEVPEQEQIVVFSQYTKIFSLLRRLGIDGLEYTGSLTSKQRRSILDKFRKRDDNGIPFNKLIFVSMKAGSESIDLTNANHVVFLDYWWNNKAEKQAVARCRRIGQTRTVNVHRVIIKDSIDEWVLHLQKYKNFSEQLLFGTDDIYVHDLVRARMLCNFYRFFSISTQDIIFSDEPQLIEKVTQGEPKKIDELSSDDDGTSSCMICIDSADVNDVLYECNTCKVWFHKDCIKTWINTSKKIKCVHCQTSRGYIEFSVQDN